jgi:sugar/nucleoside kinase (ribokinase family)
MLSRLTRRTLFLATAVLVPAVAGGCSVLTTVAYLVQPENDAPAEFKGLRGKHVAVVCKPIVELEFSDASSARELATRTMQALLPNVTVFVGGISDATAMLGIDFNGDLKTLAKQIVAEFPNLTHAAFTLRDGSTSAAQNFSGALYEAATGTLHTAPTYTITQIIDRLGAGDAFTAGLVFSFLQNSTAPSHFFCFSVCSVPLRFRVTPKPPNGKAWASPRARPCHRRRTSSRVRMGLNSRRPD